MRFIDKSECCPDFDNYIANDKPSAWKDFDDNIKLKLHQHLWREQKTLCIYCQQQTPLKKEKQASEEIRSHIEHIRPQSTYPNLIFDYSNLSVSCEGFDCDTKDKNPKKEFCEHRKHNKYDESNFLNPIELSDIETYFEYDIEGKIHPTSKDKKKAKYMIDLLYLNHQKLIDMRKEVYLFSISEKDEYLSTPEVLPPFYSMLKQLVPEKYSPTLPSDSEDVKK